MDLRRLSAAFVSIGLPAEVLLIFGGMAYILQGSLTVGFAFFAGAIIAAASTVGACLLTQSHSEQPANNRYLLWFPLAGILLFLGFAGAGIASITIEHSEIAGICSIAAGVIFGLGISFAAILTSLRICRRHEKRVREWQSWQAYQPRWEPSCIGARLHPQS